MEGQLDQIRGKKKVEAVEMYETALDGTLTTPGPSKGPTIGGRGKKKPSGAATKWADMARKKSPNLIRSVDVKQSVAKLGTRRQENEEYFSPGKFWNLRHDWGKKNKEKKGGTGFKTSW